MKTPLAAILAAYLVWLAIPTHAQNTPPRPPMQRQADAIQKILDLTDRQLAELHDLREAHQKKTQEIMTQLRDLERQRREQMQSATPDAVKIGSLALQIQSLQQQLEQENKAYREDALRVLDSAQREKVAKIEEALKLAPHAGALAAFGLLERPGFGGGRFMMGPGPGGEPGPGMIMMRSEAVPLPPPPGSGPEPR